MPVGKHGDPHGTFGGSCSHFAYQADDQWAKLPSGWTGPEAAAVATDSRDRVFVFFRGPHPIIVFERDGTFLGSWGEGLFARPHGLFIGPDDAVYCTDDLDHTVRKFTPDGNLLLTLGTSGRHSDTGATSMDYRTIRHAGPPFHFPTNMALSHDGDIYISDGYGNARIHRFTADGRLLLSWGEPGSGPGQFHLPHGIAVDRQGTVYVADRENSRIQLFTPEGKVISEWSDVVRPCQVFVDAVGDVLVAELGFHAGMWPGTTAPGPDAPGGRVSIFDRAGQLKARWGGGGYPCSPGDFFAPHAIWVDSRGDIYVSEVTLSGGGNRGLVSPDCHTLQKFVRRSGAP
jgi:DNA-binding beta-propeller fold protein YncE